MSSPYTTYERGIDLIAVERVLAGTLPHTALSEAELKRAAMDSKHSAKRTGELLGVTDKTVIRWREEGNS
jgi:hypothetical protein